MDFRWVLCENFGENLKKTIEKWGGGEKVNTLQKEKEKNLVVSNSC